MVCFKLTLFLVIGIVYSTGSPANELWSGIVNDLKEYSNKIIVDREDAVANNDESATTFVEEQARNNEGDIDDNHSGL